MCATLFVVGLAVLGVPVLARDPSQTNAAWRDRSPHHVRWITVDSSIRLEVLDWEGSGPPLVLLGCYLSAHSYDEFAPKLTISSMSSALPDAGSVRPTNRLPAMPCSGPWTICSKLNRRGVALVRALHGDAHNRAGVEIDGVLGLVRQMRAAIFHLRDVRIRIVRIVQSSFDPFFFRFRSIRAKSARVGVPMPEAWASAVRYSS